MTIPWRICGWLSPGESKSLSPATSRQNGVAKKRNQSVVVASDATTHNHTPVPAEISKGLSERIILPSKSLPIIILLTSFLDSSQLCPQLCRGLEMRVRIYSTSQRE